MDRWMDGCPHTLNKHMHAPEHTHTHIHYHAESCIFPPDGFLKKKKRLITTLSVDGMNCPQEKGTEASAQRTEQRSRTEKITEMPS